jgi:hypothetical protein
MKPVDRGRRGRAMAVAASNRPQLTPERVALLAEAVGLTIAPERLADATAALAELFSLETVFGDLALGGIDPSADDVSWPENGT